MRLMATLTATYTWAAFEVELKAWLKITVADYDAKLQGWLAVAVRAGDTYLNHFWVKDDDRTPVFVNDIIGAAVAAGADIPHPDDVAVGLKEWMRIAWQLYGDEKGGPRAFGLTSAKTGDLSEGYAVGSRIGGGEVSTEQITANVRPIWRPYRRNRFQ